MRLKFTGAVLSLGIASLLATPAYAQVPKAKSTPVAPLEGTEKQPSGRQASFVPVDFQVPTSAKGEGFKLQPLGPALVKLDFDAYMSSIEHLQATFTRSTSWPHAGITASEAMQDMDNEQARFQARRSFAYGVLTADGTREMGSVYVAPSSVEGYDAVVKMWVTQADYDAGFDAKLYAWVSQWVKAEWPFARVAYPGRSIDWSTWDARVTASKPSKAGMP